MRLATRSAKQRWWKTIHDSLVHYNFQPWLGELTDDLYKFRGYIDDTTFQKLHRFKHVLQDSNTLLNRYDRPDTNEKSYEELTALTSERGTDPGADTRTVEQLVGQNMGWIESCPKVHRNKAELFALRLRLDPKIKLSRLSESQPQLEDLNTEANALYIEITDGVGSYFDSIVSRHVDLDNEADSAPNNWSDFETACLLLHSPLGNSKAIPGKAQRQPFGAVLAWAARWHEA